MEGRDQVQQPAAADGAIPDEIQPDLNAENPDILDSDKFTGCWLVSVPRDVADLWEASSEDCVGNVRVSRQTLGHNAELTYEPSPHVKQIAVGSSVSLLSLAGTLERETKQKMAGITCDPDQTSNRRTIKGQVIQRLQLLPSLSEKESLSDLFSLFSKANAAKKNGPSLVNKVIDPAEKSKAPPQKRKSTAETAPTKKERRFCAPLEEVRNDIFEAFERTPYIRLTELADELEQPVAHVKKALSGIAECVVSGEHKNSWKLKPEYSITGEF